MKIYKSEIKEFFFTRSLLTLYALANFTGSQVEKNAVERFEILREIN